LRKIFFNVWLEKYIPVKCFPCKIFVSGGGEVVLVVVKEDVVVAVRFRWWLK
jgi:hypothetical protein